MSSLLIRIVDQCRHRMLQFARDGGHQGDIITLWVNPDMEHTIWPRDDDRVQQIPFLAPTAAISALRVTVRPFAEQRGNHRAF
jgi:hypothetical protein